MLEVFVISIGLVLVIEGTLYFFLANNLNFLISRLKELNPKTIKNFSLIMALIGLCLIYFTIRIYEN